MNPNVTTDKDDNYVDSSIMGMEKHCLYVWYHFIEKNENIKNILMIVHSAGGVCAANIISKFKSTVVDKVKFLAFVDACQGNFDE